MVFEKMVILYKIAKKQLSIIFPYRRHEWQALDLDMNNTEQVDVQIYNKDDVWDVTINVVWTMSNLRVYLGLRFDLKGDFTFVFDSSAVRRRKEESFFCKSLPFPQLIQIKQAL